MCAPCMEYEHVESYISRFCVPKVVGYHLPLGHNTCAWLPARLIHLIRYDTRPASLRKCPQSDGAGLQAEANSASCRVPDYCSLLVPVLCVPVPRGLALEILLTKVMHGCARDPGISIQVVAMSATISGLDAMCAWLRQALLRSMHQIANLVALYVVLFVLCSKRRGFGSFTRRITCPILETPWVW